MSLPSASAAKTPPIVAILRGVKHDEILDIAAALVEAGIEAIEVPMNSPDPLVSIGKLCAAFGDKVLCGAGTVLSPEAVDQVAGVAGIGVGGELYRPGYTAQEVGQRARTLVAAWNEQTTQ